MLSSKAILILGSQSRDRRELLEKAHLPFLVYVSNFDETSISEADPFKKVQLIARGKGETIIEKLRKCNDNCGDPELDKILSKIRESDRIFIITADTMVLFGNTLIGKAKDKADAKKILKKLAGNTHTLLTGVYLCELNKKLELINEFTFTDGTDVHFQKLSDYEIDKYLSIDNEFRGRAGAYSIQNRASLFIDYIEGSPTTVIGLPVAKIREIFKDQFNFSLFDLLT